MLILSRSSPSYGNEFGGTIDRAGDLMTHFIVTYDRRDGSSDILAIEDAFEAFDEFSRREHELMGSEDVEIVLLAAKHEDELRVSHPNFFAGGDLIPTP